MTDRLTRAVVRFVQRTNRHLLLALALAFVLHLSLLFFTSTRTYDAYVHMFFADTYATSWFDPWEPRWYTGFTMTSYPPGSHQTTALLSYGVGLINAFIFVQITAVLNCIVGIYRFSKIWVSEEAAGYAALLMAVSSSITETIHVFGQLPTTFSLGFLLQALPFVYKYLRDGRVRMLLVAWTLNAATTAGHHVTTLFGAVFFVAPVMVLAIVEKLPIAMSDEPSDQPSQVTRDNFRPLMMRYVRRIMPPILRCAVYGVGMIILLVIVVLPYWLWSASDPITQVSIPHASRDSFIENTAAGLVFWLIPYSVTLFMLPYTFYKGLTTKAWPMTLSLMLLVLLGTGGTTPIPRMLLGGAFDILTLDRFTFWATITMLPLCGELIVSLRHGRFAVYLRSQFSYGTWLGVQGGLIVSMLGCVIFIANLTQFRRFQPPPIDMQPIVSFLDKDEHWRWRYLTLGFGDQMAWLSVQTKANSAEGNYHSARRLPELTTTPVERLDGAKFRGIPGIGSLQQFLAVPEKYNLKFILSKDQFYDPLLYFSGWHQLVQLDNGVMVWEREQIPPLPDVLPRKETPVWQRTMWGVLPMGALIAGVTVLFLEATQISLRIGRWRIIRWLYYQITRPSRWIDTLLKRYIHIPNNDQSQVVRWQSVLDTVRALPSRVRPSTPSAQFVRTALVLTLIIIAVTSGVLTYQDQARTPEAVILAYYDDLDFRNYKAAYARLDPTVRPSFDQYLLNLSANSGLIASYAKLENLTAEITHSEETYIEMRVHTDWITSLARYQTTQAHTLVLVDNRWTVTPDAVLVEPVPDTFFRRGTVAWKAQASIARPATVTDFSTQSDQPTLEILSSRLVEVNGRHSVVGEVINRATEPADVTVTGLLYDGDEEVLTRYNAQYAILHKLLPKETTPFRVDFEAVAGAVLTTTVEEDDGHDSAEFDPTAFTPVDFESPVQSFEAYAKGIVTGRDLHRDVGVQNLRVAWDETNTPLLLGEAINSGTFEATVPHVLITYYNAEGGVMWVDNFYLESAIKSQATVPFALPITPASQVKSIIEDGQTYSNALVDYENGINHLERIPVPARLGYDSMRVVVHYFIGPGGK